MALINCPECGREVSDKAASCPNCGVTINPATINMSNGSSVKCPKCGNRNCQLTTEITSSGKDFSAGKGFCGALLLGPIGVLCGACGKGKTIQSTSYWICANCGKKFKA